MEESSLSIGRGSLYYADSLGPAVGEDFSVKEDHQFISNERNLGQRACPRRAFDIKLVTSQETSGY